MPFLTDKFHDQNATLGHTDNGSASARSATFDRDAFRHRLSTRILGQTDAVDAVTRAVSIAHAGISGPGQPLASVLLVGPTGVGKTELVRQVAAELRSGPDDLCRIDMAALAQEHYAASFSGAPPGYAGSKESFTLFDKDRIEGDPFTPGIVLLDEVEKADTTVIRALLHVLDTGKLRLANGRETISFRNCHVFITSNLGSDEVARKQRSERAHRVWRARRDQRADVRSTVRAAVESFFDPEFFNRIDEVVVMGPLTSDTARQVTAREVDLLIRQLAHESVDLRVERDVVNYLQAMGFDAVYGARGLRRTIRTHLTAPVAECLLQARPSGRAAVVLAATVSAGVIRVTPSG